MNSIVQCVNNTLPFLKYILTNEYKKDLNEDKEEHLVIEHWNEMSRSLWHKNAVFTPYWIPKMYPKTCNF